MRGGDEIEIYPSPRLLERSPGAEEEEEEEGQKAERRNAWFNVTKSWTAM